MDREIIEAMAERAAAVIVARASLIGTQLAIDNVMISAAETLIKQHRIRMQRLFDVLKAWQDEPDKPDESDTEGKQHESE